MEHPSIIASRLTETAKDVVDQARVIAKDAIEQAADSDEYTAGKFLDSVTKSVELALSGGLQLTKDVLGVVEQPGPQGSNEDAEGRRLVADAMEAISRRMIRQTGQVAHETADLLDKNPSSPTIWVKSWVKLADIALLGGLELAETALIGPGPFEKDPVTAGPFSVDTNDATHARRLRITALSREGAADIVPKDQIRFKTLGGAVQPPGDGSLPAGQTQFTIVVNPAGLISGVYLGTVVAGEFDEDAPAGVTKGTAEVEVLL